MKTYTSEDLTHLAETIVEFDAPLTLDDLRSALIEFQPDHTLDVAVGDRLLPVVGYSIGYDIPMKRRTFTLLTKVDPGDPDGGLA
jgi:hypothetical protein